MRKSIAILSAIVVGLLAVTMRIALGQSTRTDALRDEIHVVLPASQHLEFFDFNNDGLTLGDRLAAVGPLLNKDQTRRMGTSYADCWVGDRTLEDQSPYVCTYVLKFRDGNITTQGLDPHGLSDVFFAVTGGTGAYAAATGQAEYVDAETRTDIIIQLDG